jgi:hypothetical protein
MAPYDVFSIEKPYFMIRIDIKITVDRQHFNLADRADIMAHFEHLFKAVISRCIFDQQLVHFGIQIFLVISLSIIMG